MRIALITFHNALNYGAYLQTYALQEYLCSIGHTVEIIDFQPIYKFKGRFHKIPVLSLLSKFISKYRLKTRKNNFYKGFPINKLLKLSKRYNSLEELDHFPPEADVYLCGSDQIWNPICVQNCPPNTMNAYFLNFGPQKVLRVAYSVSFGTNLIKTEWLESNLNKIKNFDFISLREPTYQNKLKEYQINTYWTCDPTLLYSQVFYDKLICSNCEINLQAFVFDLSGNLSKNDKDTLLQMYPESKFFSFGDGLDFPSIGKWLGLFKFSERIITDSFHGTVFSIIYKKPFLSILNKGVHSAKNVRIQSLLKIIGLDAHAVETISQDKLLLLQNNAVDWDSVYNKLSVFIESSKSFLNKALE